MRLTPLDIRKQEFTRGFRGFEPEEVYAFLQMVSRQWEEILDDQRRTEQRVRELEAKLVHYERVEEALQEALQTARDSSRIALENAQQKAKLVIGEAEATAVEIKKEAEQDRHQIKREAAKLSGRRNEIVARLRAFLLSEMELLARYEGDDPVGFIRLLPSEEQRLRKAGEKKSDQAEASSDTEQEQQAHDPAASPEPRVTFRQERPPEPDQVPLYNDLRAERKPPDDQLTSAAPPVVPPIISPKEGEFFNTVFSGEDRIVFAHAHEEPKDEPVTNASPQPPLNQQEVDKEKILSEVSIDDSDESGQPAHRSHDDGAEREEDQHSDDDASTGHDEVHRRASWTAHSFVARPPSHIETTEEHPDEEEDEELSASSDEIDKIRRILSDLE